MQKCAPDAEDSLPAEPVVTDECRKVVRPLSRFRTRMSSNFCRGPSDSPPNKAIHAIYHYRRFGIANALSTSNSRKGSPVRLQFEKKLGNLKSRLMVMAGMAEHAIQRSVEAYQARDLSICDLVDHGERAIDHMEREIDEMATDLLATQHPLAHDLRFTLAVIKINGNLERMGNAAASISNHVRSLQNLPLVDLPVDILRMASLAQGTMRNALRAFIEADGDRAQSILSVDGGMDRLHKTTYHLLSGLIERQSEVIPQALNTMMIAGSLWRVGGHAKSIAEDVIFWVRGADVRNPMQHAGNGWSWQP
jgi:phosphate transport system protein